MSTESKSFAEQDPTVARVAEASLRMMGGAVAATTQRRIRQLAERAPDAYPWQEVVEAVLADQVEPSALVQRGLTAQRDWVLRSGQATLSRTESTVVRARPSLAWKVKRLIAIAIARSLFYSVFTSTLLVLLILVRKAWPWADIYALADRVTEAVRSVFG